MTKAAKKRFQFASRQLLLSLLVVGIIGFLLLAVFPTKTYLRQRSELQLAQRQVSLLDRANKQLEDRANQLQQDSEIEKIARQKYNLVKPGEQAYGLLPSPGDKPVTDLAESQNKSASKPSLWHRFSDFVTFWN